MSLQITSMADIFTIILVFLLKSYSTGLANLSPANGLKLPQVTASTKKEMKDALKLEVLDNAVLVDSAEVLNMSEFKIPVAEGQSTNSALVAVLNERRQKDASRMPASDAGTVGADSHLLVLADERTPYSALKVILGSAAMAGYVDLQMVVIGAGE